MYTVKVISEEFASDFENYVQELLNNDYEILNAFCGVINNPDGTSVSTYQAILTKEEQKSPYTYAESEEL